MKKAIFLLSKSSRASIYGHDEIHDLKQRLDLDESEFDIKNKVFDPEKLRDVEVVLSGWGAPKLNEELLSLMPKLELFLYGAGTVKYFVTDAFWEKKIKLTSAYAANAVPVAEFTFALIILALKQAIRKASETRAEKRFASHSSIKGTYQSVVGLVSLGMIGRMVAQRLSTLDVKVIAYDPFVTQEAGASIGVQMVSLENVFEKSDVVSIHTPWLKETEGIINQSLLKLMPPNASLINTSRGAVINEEDLLNALATRADLTAYLDVTHPEPPVPESPFYSLPNVFLTPHIAGSMGQECRRMGRYMIEELDRYLEGKPMLWELNEEKVKIMA